MVKIMVPALGLAMVAGAALAQPTPGEQRSMHIGDTATNGSSEIVTDRYGTHPEEFVGQRLVNHTSAARRPHKHHRHAFVAQPPDGGR
ncbi:MAG: hypothetical protein JSR98_00255 [Proteobacteria bacterium]|nr:hypothetical protein [Pseudomonadota bacterium]